MCLKRSLYGISLSHQGEYYSFFGKDEFLPLTSMRMELEGLMLSEISESEKDNYMVSLLCEI